MTVYGYARVSTEDQNLDLQVDALKAEGCEKIIQEKVSSRKDRPLFKRLLKKLGEGDVLVVWKYDRAARSVLDLCWIVEQLEKVGADFKSITQPLDTTTPEGRLLRNILNSFAEFERDMIEVRTKEGLKAAKARGVVLGRPTKLTALQKKAALKRMGEGELIAEVASQMGVSYHTLYRLRNASLASQSKV